jgi:hypothetical protein
MTNIEMFEIGDWCEVTTNDGYNWKAAKVLFVDELIVLIGEVEGKADRKLLRRCDADVSFRAYRTAEQIEADELKTKLGSLASLIQQEARCANAPMEYSSALSIANTLMIDGYRKQ